MKKKSRSDDGKYTELMRDLKQFEKDATKTEKQLQDELRNTTKEHDKEIIALQRELTRYQMQQQQPTPQYQQQNQSYIDQRFNTLEQKLSEFVNLQDESLRDIPVPQQYQQPQVNVSQEVDRKNDTINSLRDKIQELNMEIMQYKLQVSDSNVLSQKVQHLENRIIDEQERTKSIQKELDDCKLMFAKKPDDSEKVVKQINSDINCKQLQNELNNKKDELANEMQKCNDLESKIGRLELEIKLGQKFSKMELQNTVDNLLKKNGDLNKKSEELNKKNEELNKKNEELNKKNEELNKKNDNTMDSIYIESSKNDAFIQKSQKKLQNLQQHNRELSKQLIEVQELYTFVNTYYEEHCDIDTLNTLQRKLKDKREEKQKDNEDFIITGFGEEKYGDNTQYILPEDFEKMRKIQLQNETFKMEIQQLKDIISSQASEIDTVTLKLHNIYSKHVNEQLKSVEIQALDKKLAKLHENMDGESSGEIQALDKRLAKLKENMSGTSTTKMQYIINEHNETKKQYADCIDRAGQLRQYIIDIKNNNKVPTFLEIEEKLAEINGLTLSEETKQNAIIQQQNITMEIDSNSEVNTQLRSDLQEVQNRLIRGSAQYNAASQAARLEIHNLQQQLNLANTTRLGKDVEIERLKQEVAYAKIVNEEIEKIKMEADSAVSEQVGATLQPLLSEKDAVITRLEENVKQLNERIVDSGIQLTDLQFKNTKLVETLQAVQSSDTKNDAEITILKQTIDNFKTNVESLSLKNAEIEALRIKTEALLAQSNIEKGIS